MLVSVDVYRPAARKQLRVLARDLKLPIYEGTPEETKPVDLARSARKEAMQTGRDVLLVDTAGRLHIDDDLMTELQQLKELLNPTEILFVADAMTGQDAVKSADEFHKRLGITGRHPYQNGWRCARRRGAFDSRGHGAAAEVCGRRRKVRTRWSRFIRIAWPQRILGMGDMLSLIEKVEETIDQKQAEEMQRKLHRQTISRWAIFAIR